MKNNTSGIHHQITNKKDLFYLGIRHHGPGSARALKAALVKIKPDVILVECPADASPALQKLLIDQISPPTAIAIYDPKSPGQSLFYPLTVFSPEWISILYAFEHGIPLIPIDLPSGAKLQPKYAPKQTKNENNHLDQLFRSAGIEEAEKWWDRQIEELNHSDELFHYIFELMEFWRSDREEESDTTLVREAFMREQIRKQLTKQSFQTMAIVTGAYHIGVLRPDFINRKTDKELLSKIKTSKTVASWIPWTYHRVSQQSSYGAGVKYPGWYQHLFHYGYRHPDRWFAQSAEVLRKKEIKIPPSRVIDSTQLALALARVRGLQYPGFNELKEAFEACMADNQKAYWEIIKKELLIGSEFGSVGSYANEHPIEKDFISRLKAYRMHALVKKKEQKSKKLDLRISKHLEISQFLNQLHFLGVFFGRLSEDATSSISSFSEMWELQWSEEFQVSLMQGGIYGNTVYSAARAIVEEAILTQPELNSLTDLLLHSLLAGLTEPVKSMLPTLKKEVSLTDDFSKLIPAATTLTTACKYGNIREYDSALLFPIVHQLLVRICIGLPSQCINIDASYAKKTQGQLEMLHSTINMFNQKELQNLWLDALTSINQNEMSHPLLLGFTTRLLGEMKIISQKELYLQFSFALMGKRKASDKSLWIEGYLSSGLLGFFYDKKLLLEINNFIHLLNPQEFLEVLPILRRSFSHSSQRDRSRLFNLLTKIDEKDSGSPAAKREDEVLQDIDKTQLPKDLLAILYPLG